MSFKDLFVLVQQDDDRAGRYALEIARHCGAKLTAATSTMRSRLPPSLELEIPEDVLWKITEAGERAAQARLDAFAETARSLGVTPTSRIIKAAIGDVMQEFQRAVRAFDMVVLNQGMSEGAFSTEIVEAAVFGSGRPVLVVPSIFRPPAAFAMILVAWDGKRAAARALGDALPLLISAKRVQVALVHDEKGSPHQDDDDIIRHLANHGINAEAPPLFSVGSVADTLLSHAADVGADLLVMGGYGHSRVREIILGGTTRDILRTMTLPVLLSH